MNQTRSPLATAALVFSGLGWITFGLLAIPGVIFAHCVKRQGESDAAMAKAALLAGYSSIAVGFAVPICAVLLGAGFLILPAPRAQEVHRLFEGNGIGSTGPVLTQAVPDESTPWLLWLGLAAGVIAILTALPLLARLLRSLYSRHQVRQCLARNRLR